MSRSRQFNRSHVFAMLRLRHEEQWSAYEIAELFGVRNATIVYRITAPEGFHDSRYGDWRKEYFDSVRPAPPTPQPAMDEKIWEAWLSSSTEARLSFLRRLAVVSGVEDAKHPRVVG